MKWQINAKIWLLCFKPGALLLKLKGVLFGEGLYLGKPVFIYIHIYILYIKRKRKSR